MAVEFEEEKNFNNMYDNTLSKSPSGLTGWLIKNEFAKTEKGANAIMIVVAIICFALAIYFAVK